MSAQDTQKNEGMAASRYASLSLFLQSCWQAPTVWLPSVDQPIATVSVPWITIHPSTHSGVTPLNYQRLLSFPLPSLDCRSQPLKSKPTPGLFRKLTTRLKPLTFHPKSTKSTIPSSLTSPVKSPTPRSAVPIVSNDKAAVKRRQAALQKCGLVPTQRKDLSQLEQELDQRFSHIVVLPQDQQEEDELTTAERIRREWQAKNEANAPPEIHADDPNPNRPEGVSKDTPSPDRLGKSDSTENPEEETTLESTPPHPSLHPTSPLSLPLIPETSVFPDIPEEEKGAVVSGITKVHHFVSIQSSHLSHWPTFQEPPVLTPVSEVVDPLTVPLPDSPLPSSSDIPDLPAGPSSRENKRLPPIVVNNLTTNDANGTTDEATRGRSLNRHSMQSIASKSSLPALSSTMTASSSSSIPTPRDDESRERIEAMIARSNSGKPRSSRFGKATDSRRGSEDLDVVPETIPEGPEHTLTESKTWSPNRESIATMGSTGFEAFVEKRERKRISTGIFQSVKRNSGSIRSSRTSIGSQSGSIWSALKMTRKTTQTTTSKRPPPASLPVRRPTVRIMENRENLIQQVKGIEDDESRRLTELAFMDF